VKQVPAIVQGRIWLGHLGLQISICFVWFALLPTLPQSADARSVRIATYNIEFGTGAVGSEKYNAIRSTLARIDADIICFQELWPDTFGVWSNMVAGLGYSNTAIGANAPFSGGLYLGYASRFPILSTASAMSPPGAVELSRYPFRAVVAVPDAQRPLILWTMHHKSSDANIDKFRRSIEAHRAVQNIDAYLAANPDHSEYLFVGDMNEDVRDSQTAQYANQPAGAPASYVLGSDIAFPVHYSKFPTDRYAAAGLGLLRMSAFWENSTTPVTRIVSGRQLDYVFLSPALMDSPLGSPVSETYYSANDLGGGLPKAGARLPAGTSAAASDHLPIFFDIEMADYSTVIPSADYAAIGEAGGPFTPSSKTYTIRETNSFSTSWSIATDVAWLSISPTNPVAVPQEPRQITVSLNAGANALGPGTYRSTITFRNLTTGIEEVRDVVLTVRDHLAVLPEEGFASAGLLGGPFAPASKVYVVTNKSAVSRAFTAIASTNWLTVSPASGTISAHKAVAVTVSINANANPLLGKTYSASVVFSNQASGRVHGRPVTLAISGALCDAVDDCGQVWTTGGNSLWYYQTTNTSDGTDAARSGPITNRQTSWLETTVVGPGRISFNWKVYSLSPWHYLNFHDNGNQRAQISGNVDWNRRTYEFTSGVHTLRWTMDLSNITAAYSNSAGWLDQIAIDHFAITPTNVWTASGILDGPFSPPSRTYFLTNGGTATLQWSAAPSVPWITTEPPYGTLAPGSTSTVTLVLNEAANALPLGSNIATVVFANQNSGIEVSRRVVVNVAGDICHAVERCDLPWNTGGNANWYFQTGVSADGIDAAQSGGVGNNQQSWVETVVTGPVQLGFKWKVATFVSYSSNILSLAVNGAVRAQIAGKVDWTPTSIEIPSGIQTTRWTFATSSNTMFSPNAGWIDQITLDPFGILPSTGWDISGYLAGPYSSTTCAYVVTNAGTASFAWSFATGANWISAEPASGEIAPGSSTTVVFSLNADTDLLPRGTYATTLVFSNHTSGAVVSRQVSMVLVSPLCDAVDWCALDWTTGGQAPWFRQTAIAHHDGDAAQSGAIAANRQTWMQTVVNGPARLTFQWRVSSATNADVLTLLDNGSPLGEISGEVPWTARAYDIASGIHTLRWAYVTSSATPAGSNAAWLDAVALDYFVVLGLNSWKSTGMPGGPFTPVTGHFGITNAGPTSISWSTTTNVPWMFVIPARGVLAPSSSVGIVISLNTNANKLASGRYTGRAQFYHAGANFTIVRSTDLEVLDYLLVSPTSHVAYTSFVGGASAPLARTYSLSNAGPSSLNWSVTQDAAWISVEPVSGTLAPGTTGTVVFTLATNALPEPPGQYPALATFSNHSSRLTILRPFTLVVTGSLSVTAGEWISSGPAGGDFSPASATYTLYNRGLAECDWTAAASVPWISVDIPESMLIPNTFVQIVASIEPSANMLPAGIHSAHMLFTESATGIVITQHVSLAVGFPFCEAAEACDFDWTTGGSAPWLYQATTTFDGIDAAASGTIANSRETYMQTSIVGPGTLSFWWKISSEPGADFLEFLVNGTRYGAISGETNWHHRSFALNAGTNTLRWRYYKSMNTSVGADRAWVDQIAWSPANTAMGVPITWYEHFNLEPAPGKSWSDLDHLPAASGDPNWFQYAAGLDPTNPSSRFRLLSIEHAEGTPPRLQWLGGTNGPSNAYVIQCTADLELGPWNSTGASPRIQGINIWTSPQPADLKLYYRVLAPR
jgi:endonuclease/exonuclease/phosphatase family metal-dependent hydrolase